MNKEDNPYFTLAELISNNNNVQQINVGTVISVSPLLITCNGIQLDKNDLLINKDLLKGTKKTVNINNTRQQIENIEDGFKVGSTVVLLTQDNQRFVLLCEVI